MSFDATDLGESADIARIINRTPQTVRHLAKRGILKPVIVTPSGRQLFSKREAQRYARARDEHASNINPAA